MDQKNEEIGCDHHASEVRDKQACVLDPQKIHHLTHVEETKMPEWQSHLMPCVARKQQVQGGDTNENEILATGNNGKPSVGRQVQCKAEKGARVSWPQYDRVARKVARDAIGRYGGDEEDPVEEGTATTKKARDAKNLGNCKEGTLKPPSHRGTATVGVNQDGIGICGGEEDQLERLSQCYKRSSLDDLSVNLQGNTDVPGAFAVWGVGGSSGESRRSSIDFSLVGVGEPESSSEYEY